MARHLARLALLLATSLGSLAVAQTLTVFAASSLADALAEAARAFESERPETRISLQLAASSTLATQLLHGAPADVFVSADAVQMERVARAGLLATAPRTVAGNEVVVLAAADGPVRTIEDLAADGTLLVLAAPQVPAGRYARTLLASLAAEYGPHWPRRVLARVVSEEPSARQAAAKVALGEADAVVAYRTDAAGLGAVRVLEPPAAHRVTVAYPAATLAGSAHPELAEAFLAFLVSPAGRAVLASHGFLAVP